MSAVGSDAAFMLEKALEEMDDIFKESEEPKTFIRSTPVSKNPTKISKTVPALMKLLDELEFILSGQVLDNQTSFNEHEKRAIFEHSEALSFAPSFLQELCGLATTKVEPTPNSNISFSKGMDERIHQLEQERQSLQIQVVKLHEQLLLTESELEKTKKSLADYARKNEELLIRITENRIAEQKMRKATHNKLLLQEDEKDTEMEHLKSHIESLLDEQERRSSPGSEGDDNLSGLKARLREKASECNRLKIQLEDMKQSQESKDNTIHKVQEQIQRLFEENELLRREQMPSNNTLNVNGNLTAPNGMIPQTPDSVRSTSTSKNYFQIKGLKSASEPNLIHGDGRATVGLISPPALSVNGDDAVYRPYRRVISDAPFATWSSAQVQDWLREEGLEEYTNACAKHVKRGDDLLKYSFSDYERSLGITDPIQKRKLNYALKAVTSNSPDYAGRLDHNWVVKWLDDLGLPQYKQNFYQRKVDGRILMNMTLDDILQLKVYNLLHHSSIKRAIQFLRHQKFHPQFLREVANQSEERCDHVMLWTNQRIMHWLRSVDLAEYAPNLRGSGVHGALMVLESRFNAETLANLLSIPNNKTLLRRHVDTQFMTLLGESCQRQKEMTQKSPDYVPLNGSEKHKLRKKGLSFSTLRRRKSETDLDTLLCPLELDVSNIYSPPPALDPEVIFDLSESNSLSPSYTNDNGSESTNETSTVPRIAELSQEIDQMTSMLGNDRS